MTNARSMMSHPFGMLVDMRANRNLVYWRRRAVAVLLIVTLSLAVAAILDWVGDLSAASGRSAPRLVTVSQRTFEVRPGDTLWSIARSIQPQGDVRPMVDRLAKDRGNATLRPGERITVDARW